MNGYIIDLFLFLLIVYYAKLSFDLDAKVQDLDDRIWEIEEKR